MTPCLWLKPSECARRVGQSRDAIVSAIRTNELEAVAHTSKGRVRYLVDADVLQAWFNRYWAPAKVPPVVGVAEHRNRQPMQVSHCDAATKRAMGLASDGSPLVAGVSELVPERATFELTRQSRALFNCPIIYAAFDAEGACRYVGKSWNAHRVLFRGHHRLETDQEWQVLRVWRANVATDEELCQLEVAAIAHFKPVLNGRNLVSSPRKGKGRRQP